VKTQSHGPKRLNILWLPGYQDSYKEPLGFLKKGEVVMKLFKKSLIMFLVLAMILPINVAKVKAEDVLLKTAKTSTWLWNTAEIVTDSDKIINFLVVNNVKILYLQIDYTLKKEFYNSFIEKANEKNIAVQALDGSAGWVNADGATHRIKFFDWLTKYQQSSLETQRFQGVHLDVEPYLNSKYAKNPNSVFEKYQEFLLMSKSSSTKLNLEFSIDIPFWFHEISYKNKYGKGNVAEWIFENIKAVTIMAYRDTATGIINVSQSEMNLCEKYNVKATIAVETGKSTEGNFVTFYEEGKTNMYNQLNTVSDKYIQNSAFDGVAIHYLNSWMAMN